MITSQDIREKTFEKSTFGGYAMNEVDDFLDELANDLAASQKESAVLRGKMKVLVEKIEEYRGSEDAMRKALVSAQKIAADVEAEANTRADALVSDAQAQADAILSEARAKADALVADAQAQADAITGSLTVLRSQEELRLRKAQSSAAEFIQTMLTFTEQEQSLLSTLKDLDLSSAVAAPAPAEEVPVLHEEEPETAEPEEAPEEADEPEEAPEEKDAQPDYLKAFEEAVFGDLQEVGEDEPTLDFKL